MNDSFSHGLMYSASWMDLVRSFANRLLEVQKKRNLKRVVKLILSERILESEIANIYVYKNDETRLSKFSFVSADMLTDLLNSFGNTLAKEMYDLDAHAESRVRSVENMIMDNVEALVQARGRSSRLSTKMYDERYFNDVEGDKESELHWKFEETWIHCTIINSATGKSISGMFHTVEEAAQFRYIVELDVSKTRLIFILLDYTRTRSQKLQDLRKHSEPISKVPDFEKKYHKFQEKVYDNGETYEYVIVQCDQNE